MAGTTIAYSEITILDLIDTATYIYYSENENGVGATKAPNTNTKYIGIYSDPPVEGGQPDTNTEEYNNIKDKIVWSKYTGEKGDKGDSTTITSTSIQYAVSKNGTTAPSTGWETFVPTLNGGEYLWTKTIVVYSDGNSTESFSVSYSGIDGNDANTYYIETNQEEILLFNEADEIVFSPEQFIFRIYNNPKQTNDQQLEFKEENGNDYQLEINIEEEFVPITGSYLRLGQTIREENEQEGTIIETEEDKNSVYFNIKEYYNSLDDKSSFEVLDKQIFRFSYLINGKVAALKIFLIKRGLSSDMVKLSLHAADIHAAIQSTKLRFSSEGLEVTNGGLKILNKDLQPVLRADGDGNLILEGTVYATGGSFSGTVHATDGSFTGTINATDSNFSGTINAKEGTIGGFNISETSLISTDEKNSIKIYGKDGKIIANNIELGEGAKISNHIDLSVYDEKGDAVSITKIYNPSVNGKKFIETDNSLLTSDGILTIGNITINGISSTINGNNFLITPSFAQFSNIDCSGVIRTAVFEKNKVQSVGGSMIFKPSYKIKEVKTDNKTIVVDGSFNGASGEKVLLIAENGENITNEIDAVDGSNIILTENISKNYVSLVHIGTDESIIIGINSNSGSILNSKIYGEGLTITTLEKEMPNLFLGNLARLNNENLTGYGLYSDNVYLKGSLTTEIPINSNNKTYAGINTRSGAQKEYENIVFWAGAASQTEIDKAPFIVTENGTIYASSGVFTGTIISKSTIEGSDLYTAHIHGGTQSESAPLYIHDTERGICFYSDFLNKTVMQITSKGFLSENKNFISLTEGEANFIGKSIKVTEATIGHFLLTEDSIFNISSEGNEKEYAIVFENNSIKFNRFNKKSGEESETLENNLFVIANSEVQNRTGQLATLGNFSIYDNKNRLHYQANSNGYDLYVS